MVYKNITKLISFLKYNWIQFILLILAIYDLRIDLRLLLDFFTFSSFLYTITSHPLAVGVLITMPNFIEPLRK